MTLIHCVDKNNASIPRVVNVYRHAEALQSQHNNVGDREEQNEKKLRLASKAGYAQLLTVMNLFYPHLSV